MTADVATTATPARHRVYLEPPWVMHGTHKRLAAAPPDGFEVVVRETSQERVFKAATKLDRVRTLLAGSDVVLPTGLVKSWLERNNRPPEGTELTYAAEHLVFRPEPWVMELEMAFLVAGRSPKHLLRFHKVVEDALASSHCRRILCQSEASRTTLLADLDQRGFEHKVEVVYCSIPTRPLQRPERDDRVRILFVPAGTSTSADAYFDYKGGREVLETFARLKPRFPQLELVVRGAVPGAILQRYQGLDGLRVIDEFLPYEELERLYLTADLAMMPSHNTISMAILEAMSFGLPVVTIDSWANGEHVIDGVTGFVTPRSRRLPYYYPGSRQPNFTTEEYYRRMQDTDPAVVDGLAQAVAQLVENPDLRQRMGMAARTETERGRFSEARVSAQLGRIFAEAIDGGR